MTRNSSKTVHFPPVFQIFLKLGFADAAEGDEVHVHDVEHVTVGALLIVVVVPAAKVDSTKSPHF